MSEQNGQLLTLSNKPNKSKKVNNYVARSFWEKMGQIEKALLACLSKLYLQRKNFSTYNFSGFMREENFSIPDSLAIPPQGFS